MGNVLDDIERQQILTLGRLGWPLLRIQRATGIRRETISAYLKAAGIPVRGRGRPSEATAKPAISLTGVSTDPWPRPPSRAPQASACEPYRERIEAAVQLGRNFAGKRAAGRARTQGGNQRNQFLHRAAVHQETRSGVVESAARDRGHIFELCRFSRSFACLINRLHTAA